MEIAALPAAVRQALVEVDEDAQHIYSLMLDSMDRNGFVGFQGCLEISVEGIKGANGREKLNKSLSALQAASLVFPHPEQAGWVVKLPIAKF